MPDGSDGDTASSDSERPGFVIPFQLVTDTGILSFFSTTTIFGTPIDITLSEISLECFIPPTQRTPRTPCPSRRWIG